MDESYEDLQYAIAAMNDSRIDVFTDEDGRYYAVGTTALCCKPMFPRITGSCESKVLAYAAAGRALGLTPVNLVPPGYVLVRKEDLPDLELVRMGRVLLWVLAQFFTKALPPEHEHEHEVKYYLRRWAEALEIALVTKGDEQHG